MPLKQSWRKWLATSICSPQGWLRETRSIFSNLPVALQQHISGVEEAPSFPQAQMSLSLCILTSQVAQLSHRLNSYICPHISSLADKLIHLTLWRHSSLSPPSLISCSQSASPPLLYHWCSVADLLVKMCCYCMGKHGKQVAGYFSTEVYWGQQELHRPGKHVHTAMFNRRSC